MPKYELVVEHINANGVSDFLETFRGTHGRMPVTTAAKMNAFVEHLSENQNDPTEVRIKLTLVDEAGIAAD